jgi:hypothetical protein
METLVEYLTYVKGIGYVLVVAFLLAFITFWLMVHTKNKEMIKVVPFVVIIWLAFGAAALISNGHNENGHDAMLTEQENGNTELVFPEFYSNGSPATITAHRVEKWLGVNKTEYLAISYGSAVNFHKVMSEKIACRDCHHNSDDEIHACKDCHDKPFNPENMEQPGLKGAIHQRCMYCHKEVFGGPEDCKFCHTLDLPEAITVPAPAQLHSLTWEDCIRCHKNGIPGGQKLKIVYHDFCIKCHTTGIAGALKIPDDHTGRSGDTCKGCHKPAGG